ncbi:DUF4062 domain-containing protein [Runella sp. MFBS21]|uniref:DUF4062 domain-containing protein n=1 Tax=Runella sp. MFBS21 TaxID=3034018 RepID=UPI0023F72150|nr:DUF4062 domain-containing protein [Runella sp. MFBS21]MDF7822341.1 DUF4062 domain-containing protein [Runella sp. MFBS21]
MIGPKKKYQLFISSTYIDLQKAREEVTKVILNMYHIPIGMEMFSADNAEQWETIQETIGSSDYYILIIGHRYGSMTKEGISYTEKEFDYALKTGIPIYAFIRNRDAATSPDERDNEAKKIAKLKTFIKKVESGRMVQYWSDQSDLGQKVSVAMNLAFTHRPRTGWVRENSMTQELQNEYNKSGVIHLCTDARSLQEMYDKYFQQDELTEIDIIHCWGATWNEHNRDNIRRISKKAVKIRVILLNYKSLYIKPLAKNINLKPIDCVANIKRSLDSWYKLISELKREPENKIKIELYFSEDMPTRSIYRFGDYIVSADRNFMRRKTIDLNSIVCKKNQDGFYNNLKFEIEEFVKNSEKITDFSLLQ